MNEDPCGVFGALYKDRRSTATVLQPGWYTPVRNGLKIVSNAPITL